MRGFPLAKYGLLDVPRKSVKAVFGVSDALTKCRVENRELLLHWVKTTGMTDGDCAAAYSAMAAAGLHPCDELFHKLGLRLLEVDTWGLGACCDLLSSLAAQRVVDSQLTSHFVSIAVRHTTPDLPAWCCILHSFSDLEVTLSPAASLAVLSTFELSLRCADFACYPFTILDDALVGVAHLGQLPPRLVVLLHEWCSRAPLTQADLAIVVDSLAKLSPCRTTHATHLAIRVLSRPTTASSVISALHLLPKDKTFPRYFSKAMGWLQNAQFVPTLCYADLAEVLEIAAAVPQCGSRVAAWIGTVQSTLPALGSRDHGHAAAIISAAMRLGMGRGPLARRVAKEIDLQVLSAESAVKVMVPLLLIRSPSAEDTRMLLRKVREHYGKEGGDDEEARRAIEVGESWCRTLRKSKSNR